MSFYTGLNSELLYSFAKTGTQLNTFTTEANLMATYPLCPIPVGYFSALGANSKALRVRAFGRIGSTTTGPTMTWSVRLVASTTWSAGGLLLGSTAASTMAVSQTLAPWRLELEVILNAVETAGATTPTLGTLVSMGQVESPKGLASPGAATIPDNNVAPTNANYDLNAQYYLYLSIACGTSNAANLAQLEMLKVYGEN